MGASEKLMTHLEVGALSELEAVEAVRLRHELRADVVTSIQGLLKVSLIEKDTNDWSVRSTGCY